MVAPEHNSARASSTTIMKFTHVILMFALVGGATARAVPVENARLVAPGEAPLVMQLSEDFLAEAGVAFWPSAANYVFCYFPDPTATEKALRAEGDTPSPAAQTDARQRP